MSDVNVFFFEVGCWSSVLLADKSSLTTRKTTANTVKMHGYEISVSCYLRKVSPLNFVVGTFCTKKHHGAPI